MRIGGRYRLEGLLGRGGMGEVWRATDETLGRPVAVKLLPVQPVDPTATERFTMEARTAGRLSHRNTVAVYDFGSVDDRLYLVMEFVDGYSLATEVVAFSRLAPPRVADFGGQIAAGLAAAHREGIVHRDIKPANLLLTGDGTVKIGDFGIAHFANEASAGLTTTGRIIGTTSYLAPERALGRPSGAPADLYALGCVLYELLAGRPPFTGENPASILYQHVETAAVPIGERRPEVPAELAGLVHHLLDKDPERRPTAQQVADWLATSVWGTGVPEPRAGMRPAGPAATAESAAYPGGVPPTSVMPAYDARTPAAAGAVHETAAPVKTAPRSRRYLLGGAAAAVVTTAAVLAVSALSDPPAGSALPHTSTSGSATAPGPSRSPASSGPATPTATRRHVTRQHWPSAPHKKDDGPEHGPKPPHKQKPGPPGKKGGPAGGPG